jgi:hypothetical protein
MKEISDYSTGGTGLLFPIPPFDRDSFGQLRSAVKKPPISLNIQAVRYDRELKFAQISE